MSKGGARKGAGAKPKGEAPRTKINITIDAKLLKWLDSVTDNRSNYINQLIEKNKNDRSDC